MALLLLGIFPILCPLNPFAPPRWAFTKSGFSSNFRCLSSLAPLPTNSSSAEIAAALLPFLSTIFFHDFHASILPVSGDPAKHHTMDHPNPTSAQSLQHLICQNNFTYLLRGGRNLDDRIVKGRIHLRTCNAASILLNSITLSHPTWILRLDQFNGDLPTDCGWFLYSSARMNRSVLQAQLKALSLEVLGEELPIICFWRKIHGPGQYPTISASTIVVASSPPFQAQVRRLLQEIISPNEQNCFLSRYPCQRNMVFLSPTFISLTDYAYAHKLQEQQQFKTAEDAVRISGLRSLDHVLPDSFDTLGNALLSLPEPSPGQNYLIRSIETDKFDPSVVYFCTHFANKSYVESVVETLYPTLLQHYPALTSADVWHDPGLHTTTVTLDELVSSSTTELDSLLRNLMSANSVCVISRLQ